MFLASCRRKYPLEYSFSLTDEFIKFFISSPEKQRPSFTSDDHEWLPNSFAIYIRKKREFTDPSPETEISSLLR